MWIANDKLLDAVIVTGAGEARELRSRNSTFQATVVADSGVAAAVVTIEVSDDKVATGAAVTNWLTAGTITLSGTSTATDGFVIEAAWRYVRAHVTSISGTNSAVTATIATEK
jgi:hypothetical protein